MDSFYFTVNKIQHFTFPHSDADVWTDDALWAHYIKPDYFAAYMVRQIDATVAPATILSADIPGFRAAAVAWMRLKFLCEVLEPVYILKKRNSRWRFTSEVLTWTAEEITERSTSADVCCNIIGLKLCELLYALTKHTDTTTLKETLAEWKPVLETFNAAIHTIRSVPLALCQWYLFSPQELVPFPWCTFIERAYATLPPLLSALHPISQSA